MINENKVKVLVSCHTKMIYHIFNTGPEIHLSYCYSIREKELITKN